MTNPSPPGGVPPSPILPPDLHLDFHTDDPVEQLLALQYWSGNRDHQWRHSVATLIAEHGLKYTLSAFCERVAEIATATCESITCARCGRAAVVGSRGRLAQYSSYGYCCGDCSAERQKATQDAAAKPEPPGVSYSDPPEQPPPARTHFLHLSTAPRALLLDFPPLPESADPIRFAMELFAGLLDSEVEILSSLDESGEILRLTAAMRLRGGTCEGYGAIVGEGRGQTSRLAVEDMLGRVAERLQKQGLALLRAIRPRQRRILHTDTTDRSDASE